MGDGHDSPCERELLAVATRSLRGPVCQDKRPRTVSAEATLLRASETWLSVLTLVLRASALLWSVWSVWLGSGP